MATKNIRLVRKAVLSGKVLLWLAVLLYVFTSGCDEAASGGGLPQGEESQQQVAAPAVHRTIGIQAGHGNGDTGAQLCAGASHPSDINNEADLNKTIANKVADLLRAVPGYDVTVFVGHDPALRGFTADAFVALHADQPKPSVTGYKVTRRGGAKGSGLDGSGDASDRLVQALWNEYGSATGLPRDTSAGHFTSGMLYYYALGDVSTETPAAIIEMGWLCDDLPVLLYQQDRVAQGIASAVVKFLGDSAPLSGGGAVPPVVAAGSDGSSIEITVVAATALPAAGVIASLYEHCDYGGSRLDLTGDMADLGSFNATSAIRIYQDYTVILYDQVNYGGQPGRFDQDTSCLVEHSWDNRARSVRLEPHRPAEPPTATAPLVACLNDSTFVEDVTIPDETQMQPGQAFTKTWRLRNNGSCDWNQDYALIFIEGDQMGGVAAVNLARIVHIGETVDLSVSLVAPATPGSYLGRWQLRAPDGTLFGDRTYVEIVVVGQSPPGPSGPPEGQWRAEYFDNIDFTGTQCPPEMLPAFFNKDWGTDRPCSSFVNGENWSARFTGSFYFVSSGSYAFHINHDDGARLFVDDAKVYDDWDHSVDAWFPLALNTGNHALILEYNQRLGGQHLSIEWFPPTGSAQPPTPTAPGPTTPPPTTPPPPPSPTGTWYAVYYNEENFTDPRCYEDVSGANFSKSWEGGTRPCDSMDANETWSASFEGTFNFTQSWTYTFTLGHDDGARLFVDGQLILDVWGSTGSHSVQWPVNAGSHTLRIEYYQHLGGANLSLSVAG